MKTTSWTKKFSIVFLALIMTISIAACSGNGGEDTQDLFTKAQESMNDITSMHYDMIMDMEMSVMGQSLAFTTNMAADYITKPLQMKMETASDMGGGSTMYLVEKDGVYNLYTGTDLGDGNITWTKDEISDMDEIAQYDAKASMDLYLSSAESFKANGTEEINGNEAARYDGVISKEAMDEVMRASGILDQVGETGTEDMAAILSDLEAIPISIWIDKTSGIPVKYEMDMTALMQKVMSATMEDMGSGDESITISKVFLSMTMSEFNNITDIEIPDEALNAD